MYRRGGRGKRRWPLAVGGTVLLLIVIWAGLCWRYVAHPTVDPYQSVDAIYVLGPAETRIDLGRELAAEYGAESLLVTVSVNEKTGEVYEKDFCDKQAGYEVICLNPDPYTTQGEAEELAAYAEERGWDTVAVLTGTPHISRARLWTERYVQADVVMWETDEVMSLTDWAYAFVYQSGAWAKAIVIGA